MLNHTQSASKTLAADYRARRAAILAMREQSKQVARNGWSAGAFARSTATVAESILARGSR